MFLKITEERRKFILMKSQNTEKILFEIFFRVTNNFRNDYIVE